MDIFYVDDIHRKIEESLLRAGLLFRVFSRGKTDASLREKLVKNSGKYGGDKKIQDAIGVRVVLYFSDDVDIANEILREIFELDEGNSVVDDFNVSIFAARRHNLVFMLPQGFSVLDGMASDLRDYVDETFEVQIRTTLSEGWHEVEHDLRYKRRNDWLDRDVSSRALNGVYAALETSDWTMLKIFDDLAYDHYKDGRWGAMLRSKFRMRLPGDIDTNLISLFDGDREIAKSVYRADRSKVIKIFYEKRPPVNINNLVYVVGFLLGLDEIKELAPKIVSGMLADI